MAAVVLLLLLVTGITPKRYLHDLFADHHDRTPAGQTQDGKQHLTYAGYDCDNDNLVATSPFVAVAGDFASAVRHRFIPYQQILPLHPLPITTLYVELRGPPAISPA